MLMECDLLGGSFLLDLAFIADHLEKFDYDVNCEKRDEFLNKEEFISIFNGFFRLMFVKKFW